jgi:uncharacterized protein
MTPPARAGVSFYSTDVADGLRPLAPHGDLPLFCQALGDHAMFYTPGYVAVAGRQAAGRVVRLLAGEETGVASEAEREWATGLRRRAAQQAQRTQEDFAPECLTLYLNNECNLNCLYCFSDPVSQPAPRLSLAAIRAAAALAASACRARHRPMTVALHGGGEPTLHPAELAAALSAVEQAAQEHGVTLFRYIATNGVMPAARARWLAQHFDLIGLSCDGPSQIQNAQRPQQGGGATAHIVERTGGILHNQGRRLHVRVTITPETMARQAEIVSYICRVLQPEEIHLEPVYRGGRAGAAQGFGPQDAATFSEGFLEALAVAEGHGVALAISGTRLAERHGPYCNVLRNVLNLVPGDAATACFKHTHRQSAAAHGMVVGAMDGEQGCFVIDDQAVRSLRQRLAVVPQGCSSCFNRWHCAGDCPDACLLEGAGAHGFRCRVQKMVAYALLQRAADDLWAQGEALNAQRGTIVTGRELA